MDKTREDALTKINNILDKYIHLNTDIHAANEAKTRLILIDEILNALGWNTSDFNPETRTPKGQYLDYLLTIDDIPRVIVEAKRVGNTFYSNKKLKKTEYPISYIQSAFGQPFTEALEQTKKYAIETRVPLGVITNGIEWFLLNFFHQPESALMTQSAFILEILSIRVGILRCYGIFYQKFQLKAVMQKKKSQ